jgi:hypothetical protein
MNNSNRTSRANIDAFEACDPFPKSGLVKQYEPFIREWVAEFCKQYPGVSYDEALFEAVKIAIEFEPKFKADRGLDFSTPLRHYLKGLHRILVESEEKHEGIRTETPAQRKQRELEERHIPPRRLNTAGGANGIRLVWDVRWGSFDPDRRKRAQFGVQLHSGDAEHAKGVMDRARDDVQAVLGSHDKQDIVAGRMRAFLEHTNRRQQEATAEAENRQAGDFEAVLLEPQILRVDLIPYRGGKRPKFLPTFIAHARLDAPYTHEDGWVGTLQDTIADGGTFLSVVEQANHDLRNALAAERPFLSDSERHMLDWAIDPGDRTQGGAGSEIGLSKGGASKALWRATERVATRLKASE